MSDPRDAFTSPVTTSSKKSQLQYKISRLPNWETIYNWEPAREVWPFTYGLGILAAATSASGVYFNYYYRRKVHLGSYGGLATYAPLVILPAIITGIVHPTFVTRGILEGTSCPVCLEVRAIALQVSIGLLYPVVLAPISAFSLANSYYTYSIPPTIRGVLKLWWSMSKKLTVPMNVIAVTQVLLAAFVTYSEQKTWARLQGS